MSSKSNKKNMSSVKMTKTECSVCTEDVYPRHVLRCPFCEFECCKDCIKTFLMGIVDDKPRCMSPDCKKVWSLEFLANNFQLNFHNKSYRDRRAQLLLEREKSLLPGTQDLVALELRKIEKNAKTNEILEENEIYYHIINKNNKKISKLRKKEYFMEKKKKILKENQIYYHIINKNDKKISKLRKKEYFMKKKKKIFTRACPVDDCRGFLSTALKCGICKTYACKDCHLPKKSKKDDEHKCEPGLIATVKLLASDTKPCPSCATPIYKISGCFDGKTVIPMWNGSYKVARDIVVGDEIIGDDGNIRTVVTTTRGFDEMYKIMQNKGEDYIVNSKHILVLKAGDHKTISRVGTLWKVKWFDNKAIKYYTKNFDNKLDGQEFLNSIVSDNIVEITTEEYMNLPTSTKRTLVGFRSNGVNWNSDVNVDPYIIGSWLSDGNADHTEVVQKWIDWVEKNDAEIVHTQAYRFPNRRIEKKMSRNSIGSIGSEVNDCKGYVFGKRTDPLTDALNQYNLVGNKHIPRDYMTGSRSTRLELLAGLIDTDGCVSNDGKRVTIIQKNEMLSKQIISLSRSLGFVTHSRIRVKKQVKLPNMYEYEINISGELLGEIPTLVRRKKCVGTLSNNDYLRTSINIENIGIGEYFGWEVTNNKRFVLDDYTVVHNCDQMYCTTCNTAFSWKQGTIERGIIHNPHYYEMQRKLNGGIAPRNIGDIQCGAPSFLELGFALIDFGFDLTSIDEVHRLIEHIRLFELPRYPATLGEMDNSSLRVDYLLNRIDEKTWAKKLKMKMKKQEKNKEINDVLTMFVATAVDIFRNIVNAAYPNVIIKNLASMTPLREYTNNALKNIGHRYGGLVVPFIDDDWIWWNNSKTVKKKKRNKNV